MAESKHEIWELRQWQSLPLSVKVAMTKERIREWIKEYGVNGVYVSFSGGKDSTVLLDLVRQDFPNVLAVFIDTGLEYPEIKEFVKSFDNVEIIKPKLSFKQVIEKYGYPFPSKEVSECVYGARKYLTALEEAKTIARQTDRQTDRQPYSQAYRKPTGTGEYAKSSETPSVEQLALTNGTRGGTTANIENSQELENLPRMTVRTAKILDMLTKDNQIKANIPKADRSAYSQTKWKFLLDADFPVSNQCCVAMKKTPAHKYGRETGRRPMTAQMADESRLRTQQWLNNGCNGFDMKEPVSNPMAFWTEQDVLQYIYEHNLKIASVYGEVVNSNEVDGQLTFLEQDKCFSTTKCKRTGCVFCLYGIHLEKSPNRLEKLKESHPKLYDYVMRPESEGGLGYKTKIDWINEHGNLNIKY